MATNNSSKRSTTLRCGNIKRRSDKPQREGSVLPDDLPAPVQGSVQRLAQ
ncbi:MAG: hypothetical protein IPK92_16055 [Nitrospira sp.]|nr:hypothetical protein [Nitrospira sp.]